MRYPRAYQLSAAIDDISCGCPAPPQPPAPSNTLGKLRRLLGKGPQIPHARQQAFMHEDAHAHHQQEITISHTQGAGFGCETVVTTKVPHMLSKHLLEDADL
jgi:hypothetical protein